MLNGLKRGDEDYVRHYTLDRLLTIFRKICDALSLAHARGVVHRDLKPENVMVGEFGEVLVMDWGIAKILGDANQTAEESKQGNEVAPAHGVRRREPPLSIASQSAGSGRRTPHASRRRRSLGISMLRFMERQAGWCPVPSGW